MRIKVFNSGWWTLFIATAILTGYIIYNPVLLKPLAVFAIISFIIYKYYLSIEYEKFNIFNELPLNLCNINLIYYTIGIFTGNQIFLGFCFIVGPIGALMALLMPEEEFIDVKLFSGKGLGFYGTHFLLVAEGLLVYLTGVYKPAFSHILHFIVLGLVTVIIAHIINTVFRKTVCPEANYCFTYGFDSNPILKKAKQFININCIYLFPLVLVFVLVYYIIFLIII